MVMVSRISYFGLSLIFLSVALGSPWATQLFFVDSLLHKELYVSVAVLSALLLTTFQVKNIKNEFQPSKSQIFLISYFVFALVSFLWVDDIVLYLSKFYVYIVGFFVFLYTYFYIRDKENLNKLLWLFLLTASLVSLIGISQAVFNFPSPATLPNHAYPGSTFGNKNAANHLFPLLVPLVVFSIFSNSTGIILKRLSFFSLFILILPYIYYSMTKSVILALFIQFILFLIFYFYLKLKKKQTFFSLFNNKRVFLYLILGLFLSVSFLLFLDGYITYINDGDFQPVHQKPFSSTLRSADASMNIRLELYLSALKYFLDTPILGNGLGSFHNTAQAEAIHLFQFRAHNDLLQIMSELGLIGLVLFLGFLFYLIKDFFRFNFLEDDHSKNVVSVIMVSFCGSFVNMMLSWPYETTHGVVIFSSLLAIFYRFLVTAESIRVSIYLNDISKNIIFSLFLVLLFFSVFHHYSWANNMSNFYLNSGNDGHKYNFHNLKQFFNFPYRNVVLEKIARPYWDAGYQIRANEIYSIQTDLNKNSPPWPIYRRFLYFYDAKNSAGIQQMTELMNRLHPNHPLGFEMNMLQYRDNGQPEKANDFYQRFKDDYFKMTLKQLRSLIYLHRWSISLQKYEDTEYFYNQIMREYASGSQTSINGDAYRAVNARMVNFYAYTNNFEKGADLILPLMKWNKLNPDKPVNLREDILSHYKKRNLLPSEDQINKFEFYPRL